jgi:beta-hydroxylase
LHIGLKVPDPPESCGFKLDGKTVHWEIGKSFMFDQTYRHEAWNNSDEVRIVLLLDVLRPLPSPLRQLNGLLAKIGGNSFIGNRMSQVVERWTTTYPQKAGRKAEAVRSPM